MSVFTSVSAAQLSDWLSDYAVGRLFTFVGISDGVQNSNFFVTTTLGRYVLTLFERIPRSELPFYLYLTAHLAHHGLPVPAPVANRHNEYLGTLSDRPAALVTCLHGNWLRQPQTHHCSCVGAMLAGLHRAGQSYGRKQLHPRGPQWREQAAIRIDPHLSTAQRKLLSTELAFQRAQNFSALPEGIIHADLFRDNVLWNGDHIGGVIDFYFAGLDHLLFDVAVTVNDWCADEHGQLDLERTQALLQAYHAERPFTTEEQRAWQPMLRAAALRFWLSRAEDKHLPTPGEIVQVKDPDEYHKQLLQRIDGTPQLPQT